MDSNKTNRAYLFGRFFNDKQATPCHTNAVSTTPSSHNLPDVAPQVQQQQDSKWKKMEKARRVMIDILERSAPCLLGDTRNHDDNPEADTAMDFSPEPFYEECAALMLPKVPSKDMARFKEILLQKPVVVPGPLGGSCSWQFYTPPNTSILSSPAPSCFISASIDEAPDETGRHIGPSSKKESRWSLDSEDPVYAYCLSNSTLPKLVQLHGFEKSQNAAALQDSVKSTIPFPAFKELNVVGSDIASLTEESVAARHSCNGPSRAVLSPSDSASCHLSDAGGLSSPTASSSSPSTASLYSQETGSPRIQSEAYIIQEADIRSPIQPLLEDLSTGYCFEEPQSMSDVFDAKRNRRPAIYTDCGWVLGALRILTDKPKGRRSVDSTATEDSDNALDCTEDSDAETTEPTAMTCGRFSVRRDQQDVQPTLLPTHINLRRATSRKDSPKLADYVVHPPGSKYTSPQPQASEKF